MDAGVVDGKKLHLIRLQVQQAGVADHGRCPVHTPQPRRRRGESARLQQERDGKQLLCAASGDSTWLDGALSRIDAAYLNAAAVQMFHAHQVLRAEELELSTSEQDIDVAQARTPFFLSTG